jgi:holo-[acyl-carrier protein] synthase
MIIGIGIDLVTIERFALWHTYSRLRLKKIFSDQEIDYCLSVPIKSAERFAARFAAKEAIYKVLHGLTKVPFLTLCKQVAVDKGQLVVAWHTLQLEEHSAHLSISHGQTIAIAMVVIQKSNNR